MRRKTGDESFRALPSQRIAILVDSENLEITVSQSYGAAGSRQVGRRDQTGGGLRSEKNIRRTVFPNWKRIIPDVVRNRTLVRSIYYKRRERVVSDKFRKMWETELGGEIKQPIKSVDPYMPVTI